MFTSGSIYNAVMDSYSGMFPFEFVSFYIDMASEGCNEANPVETAEAQMEESVPQTHVEAETSQADRSQECAVQAKPKRPEDAVNNQAGVEPTFSPSTDERISACIERTLRTLGCQRTGLDINFLPPNDSNTKEDLQEPEVEKASQSDLIAQVTTEHAERAITECESDRQTDVNSETGFSIAKVDYVQTDTSDDEELLDSSGVATAKESPILIPLERASTTGSEASKHDEPEATGRLATITNLKPLSPTRPLSASARSLINQHFTETNSSTHPLRHATVAFNQRQVHSILRAISNETVFFTTPKEEHVTRSDTCGSTFPKWISRARPTESQMSSQAI